MLSPAYRELTECAFVEVRLYVNCEDPSDVLLAPGGHIQPTLETIEFLPMQPFTTDPPSPEAPPPRRKHYQLKKVVVSFNSPTWRWAQDRPKAARDAFILTAAVQVLQKEPPMSENRPLYTGATPTGRPLYTTAAPADDRPPAAEADAHISDAELTTDIRNTQAELAAYRQLAAAHTTLASLPEMHPGTSPRYDAQRYDWMAEECQMFLQRLLVLQDERGRCAAAREPGTDE